MTKYIIYLEGNIASGKSTLLPRISNALKTMLNNTNIYEYPEPLHIWSEIKHCDKPLLQLLYDNPQYSDRFQYMALITRHSQYMDFLEKPGDGLAIIERSYLSDKLFQNMLNSEGYINKIDMDIYALAHKPTIKHIHIYVRTSPYICYERIHNLRKRHEENKINILYLEKLNILHEQYFMKDTMLCINNDNEPSNTDIRILCDFIINMIKSF
jgi:deoxyadenosine/deoxycytidine kinase